MGGGYSVLTGSVLDSTTRERELVETFSARRVDGLVVSPNDDLVDTLALERRNGVVVVYIDRVPGRLDADAVVSDNRAGAPGRGRAPACHRAPPGRDRGRHAHDPYR